MDHSAGETVEYRSVDLADDDHPEVLELERELYSSEGTSVWIVRDGEEKARALKLFGAVTDPDRDLPQRPWQREADVLRKVGTIEIAGRPSPFPEFYSQGAVENQPAILREYIAGIRLDHWVQGLREGPGYLPAPMRFDRVLLSAASAIAVLNENQIIHADVDSRNILVDESDNAYIIDFNVSKLQRRGQTTYSRLPLPQGIPNDHPIHGTVDLNEPELMDELIRIVDPCAFGHMVRALLMLPELSRIGYRPSQRARWTHFCEDTDQYQRLLRWKAGDLKRTVSSVVLQVNAAELDDPGPDAEFVNLATGPVPLTGRAEAVVDSKVFARMRQLRQLSLVRHIHAGAEHTRWEHLVQTFDLSRRFARAMLATPLFRIYMDDSAQRQLLGVSLLHDLNHFPFMHYLQESLPDGVDDRGIITRIFQAAGEDPSTVLRHFDLDLNQLCRLAFDGVGAAVTPSEQIISSMISSAVDIDKMSYISLDSIHSGVRFGRGLEIETLVRLASVDWVKNDVLHITFEERAIPAIDMFLAARASLYQAAYWHRINRSMMAMVTRDFLEASSASGDEIRFLMDFIAANLVGGENTALGWIRDQRVELGLTPGISHQLNFDRSSAFRRVFTLKPEWPDDKQTVSAVQDRLSGLHGAALEARRKTILGPVREELAAITGVDVADSEVLLDSPRRAIGIQERADRDAIYIRSRRGTRRYQDFVGEELPGDANLRRIRSHVRVFVAPPLYRRLRDSWSSGPRGSEHRLREALARGAHQGRVN